MCNLTKSNAINYKEYLIQKNKSSRVTLNFTNYYANFILKNCCSLGEYCLLEKLVWLSRKITSSSIMIDELDIIDNMCKNIVTDWCIVFKKDNVTWCLHQVLNLILIFIYYI